MLGAHSSKPMMSTDSSEKWNSLITPRLTVTCFQISIIGNWQHRMRRSQCWGENERGPCRVVCSQKSKSCHYFSVEIEKWFIKNAASVMGWEPGWQLKFLKSGLNSFIKNLRGSWKASWLLWTSSSSSEKWI